MSPGSYTELFFLDEATAFSAGHRPCAECRRERFQEFKSAWTAANVAVMAPADPPAITAIDSIIHAERMLRGGKKVTYAADLGSLPDGTMVEVDGVAYLIWQKRRLRWSFAGYTEVKELRRRKVQVLTPASIVRVLSGGFRPEVHASARQVIAG